MLKVIIALLAATLALLSRNAEAFSLGSNNNNNNNRNSVHTVESPQPAQDATLSRTAFLNVMLAGTAAAACAPTPVLAKDIDPSLKGTKKDPSFESCLSKCIFECTKPKGSEQRSRSECLPECREKCATSKAQLMRGEPKE
eukprot:CAMPEP_0198119080 /NCGR_PEP_ID=MMETSP1442-20131203/24273_1 /TAXON_ID= /ORGANISM="Craspedostauros australis, Strain CCMP3328" /LENGTH=140 /DNA_ID=CAMNT_0043777473 /DNA_START=223 /DNA_END=645 /DNA_ORIENTATION=+